MIYYYCCLTLAFACYVRCIEITFSHVPLPRNCSIYIRYSYTFFRLIFFSFHLLYQIYRQAHTHLLAHTESQQQRKLSVQVLVRALHENKTKIMLSAMDFFSYYYVYGAGYIAIYCF